MSDRKKLPESEVANSIRKRVGKNSLRYRPIYPRCQMPSRRFFGKFLRFSRTPARHHKPLDFSGLRLSPGDVPGVFPGLEQISNAACCPCWFQCDPREFESRPATRATKVHLHGAPPSHSCKPAGPSPARDERAAFPAREREPRAQCLVFGEHSARSRATPARNLLLFNMACPRCRAGIAHVDRVSRGIRPRHGPNRSASLRQGRWQPDARAAHCHRSCA